MKIKKAEKFDVALGLSLRARRNIAGMSQERLATALGITFQQIQKYEHGVNRISVSRLFQIAGILGCSVSDFIAEQPSGPGLSDEAIKLARRYDAVRDPALKAIMSRTLGAFEKEARPARELAHVR